MNSMRDAFSKIDMAALRGFDDAPSLAPTSASAPSPVKPTTVPLRQRLWQLIKDRGSATAQWLAATTGEDARRISNSLSQMSTYGLINCARGSGRGAPGTYTANGATYEEAAQLQRRPLAVTSIRPSAAPAAQAPAVLPVTGIFNAPTTLGSIPVELENYTIAQLKDLKDVLNALFPGG